MRCQALQVPRHIPSLTLYNIPSRFMRTPFPTPAVQFYDEYVLRPHVSLGFAQVPLQQVRSYGHTVSRYHVTTQLVRT